MENLKIFLIDINDLLVKAWKKEFSNFADIHIISGSIFDSKVDALVSPANSFGIMDGGLDGKIRDRFGFQVEDNVRKIIQTNYFGELPIGIAIIAETGSSECKYIISAPTMRTPENVSNTINAYLAMKAILNVALQNPKIVSVAIPGLCSLSGQMSPEMVSRQMRIAYERVVLKKYQYTHWREEKQFERFIRNEISYPPDDLERKF